MAGDGAVACDGTPGEHVVNRPVLPACDKLTDVNDAGSEPKKVVRRVVKRTVVKPVAAPRASTPAAHSESPVAQPAVRRSSTVTQVQPVEAKTPVSVPSTRRRPSVDISGTAGKVGGAVSGGVGSAGRAISSGAGRVRDGAVDLIDTVRAWRIPQIEPVKASLITGLLAGLLVTALGALLLLVFEWLRGVSTGGGFWGSISIAVLTVVCLYFGSWLLRSFGVSSPFQISLIGVSFALTLELIFFLTLTYSAWAWLIVPVITTASYFAAAALVRLSEEDYSQRDDLVH